MNALQQAYIQNILNNGNEEAMIKAQKALVSNFFIPISDLTFYSWQQECEITVDTISKPFLREVFSSPEEALRSLRNKKGVYTLSYYKGQWWMSIGSGDVLSKHYPK